MGDFRKMRTKKQIESSKESRKKLNEKAGKKCKECGKLLYDVNKTGYCKKHIGGVKNEMQSREHKPIKNTNERIIIEGEGLKVIELLGNIYFYGDEELYDKIFFDGHFHGFKRKFPIKDIQMKAQWKDNKRRSQFSPEKKHHGITITDVKVVGLCSKCRKEDDEVPRFKDKSIIPDKDISCLNNAFGDCKSSSSPEVKE